MAERLFTPGSKRSTARQAVPLLVCTLLLAQTAAIVWLWQERSTLQAAVNEGHTAKAKLKAPIVIPPPPVATNLSLGAGLSAAPASNGSSISSKDIVIPPMPTLAQGGSAALPAVPSRSPGVVPPLPVQLPPGVVRPAPPQPPAQTLATASPTPQPQPATAAEPPAAPTSRTGSPEMDEVLDNARQMRELGAPDAALEALRQADLSLPNNPAVKRELAFTLQKMGRAEEARAVLQGSATSTNSAPSQQTEHLQPTGSMPPLISDAAPPSLPAPKGPVRLGTCELKRDMTSADGNRMNFSVPLIAAAAGGFDPGQMNVDVFFYEQTEGGKVELRRGEKPEYAFDEVVDFSSGTEFLNVTFAAPSEEDLATHGMRHFYGYIVKLYYKQQLIDTQASPQTLLTPPA